MKVLVLLLVGLIGAAVAENDDTVWTPEMVQDLFSTATVVGATVPGLVAHHGYFVESHYVTTEDGYILQMHRIPASPKSPEATSRGVVFLMHGLCGSSAAFILMGPGKALAYVLADAGYDVWLGNARGNTYSKNHTTITDFTSKKFWDFEWHEIGIYDLPAMIDYVLENTGQEKVSFVGHSQGATTFYVMASLKPEYNDKIEVMFSLGPVAYMSNLISPVLRLTAKFEGSLGVIFNLFGQYEFLPSHDLISTASSTFCEADALTQYMCSNSIYFLMGFNKAQTNTSMLPIIVKHMPAGASTRQVIHYGQEINSGKFRQWDYGLLFNQVQYGRLTPPDYELSRITAPVHLLYSDNDWMAAVEVSLPGVFFFFHDVKQLYEELGNPIEMYRIMDGSWNHLDFVFGINAKELVYEHMLAVLQKRYSD
ncbi:lipase 3-like isoform X1 [Neodiprion virginianus]|uniref:lipase 3-like isoform X1 n=1 Tax=Neodiprion virginianus TaxID=2961670 RepID=UPI001EE6D0FE|nr:lipase 3-like isoform X1 [Neodiprion virginianus]XP_046626355.1 lipase 3-like isoform X1 [Neodiprion virginianus]